MYSYHLHLYENTLDASGEGGIYEPVDLCYYLRLPSYFVQPKTM